MKLDWPYFFSLFSMSAFWQACVTVIALSTASWLLGLVLAPDNGARLLFNCAVLGLLSALAWLAMTRDGAPARHALPLALALPLLPSLLPALAGLQPFLAFDPLAACLCLAAYPAYQRGNDIGVLAALAAALLTKETALPVAAALPLHALLCRQYRRTAALALPHEGMIQEPMPGDASQRMAEIKQLADRFGLPL